MRGDLSTTATTTTDPERALEPLLSVSEAARLLRVSEQTVRRLMRRGQLPGFRVGAQWRIDRDGLGTHPGRTTHP